MVTPARRPKRSTQPDEALQARVAALHESLSSLVRHVRKVGGYMSPEDQQTLRNAEALLVEAGL